MIEWKHEDESALGSGPPRESAQQGDAHGTRPRTGEAVPGASRNEFNAEWVGMDSSDSTVVVPITKGWRGGTPPGRPKKGLETKKAFHERVEQDEVYREIVNQVGESELDLYNAAAPSTPIVKESFDHRVIAYMRASGMTRKEIFVRLGGLFDSDGKPMSGSGKYSYVHIGNILAQPWFRKRVVELQHEAGLDQVEAAIKAELPQAVETIVEVMNNTKASHTARLSAAAQILDRGLGKPVQRVEQSSVNAHTHVIEDARLLDREIEAVTQELRQLGAHQ